MRRNRDPDRLDVSTDHQDRVFIWFDYDEGTSTTLTVTAETAVRLSKRLKAAALQTGVNYHEVVDRTQCRHDASLTKASSSNGEDK